MKKYFETIAFFLLLITVLFTFASCKTKADEKINLTAYTDVPYENKAETGKYAKFIAKVIDSSYQKLIGIKKIELVKGYAPAIFVEYEKDAVQKSRYISIYFQITPTKYKDFCFLVPLFIGEYKDVDSVSYEVFIADINNDGNKELLVFYKGGSLDNAYFYLTEKKNFALVNLSEYRIKRDKVRIPQLLAAINSKNYHFGEDSYINIE